MKNLHKTFLSLAIVGAAASGISEHAAAGVYGGAGVNIDSLALDIRNSDGSLATINSFDFRTTTQADLNGTTVTQTTQTCDGTPLSNNCGDPGPALVLNSAPASIGIARVDNAFTFLGPVGGGADFGSSDNVIWDAAAANPCVPGTIPGTTCDLTTRVQGIAEAQLDAPGTAGATSTIRSTNQLTIDFTVAEGSNGTFTLNFLADPDLYSELFDPDLLSGTASSSLTATFRLSGMGNNITWAPNGAIDACTNAGTAVCTETADSQALNLDSSAPFGGSDPISWDPNAINLTPFGISITGLVKGNYSFTLATTQEANVTRRNTVPVPGTLMLMGLGLAGVGVGRRLRKKH